MTSKTQQLELYQTSVADLARNCVVKFSQVAHTYNSRVRSELGPQAVIEDEPDTWMYFQNICGIQHLINTPMRVRSLDTTQEIDFTKEVLQDHPLTLQAYQFGTKHWRELSRLYPENSLLIQGILYPAQLQIALDAPDGSILSYPTGLVADYEPSLMDILQSRLIDFVNRHYLAMYGIAHDLYMPLFLVVVSDFLEKQIYSIRESLSTTHEAHEFHLRMKLAGFIATDEFLDVLSRNQALYLYRNIRRLCKNPGQSKTVEDLIKVLYTESGLPMSVFRMYHDGSSLVDTMKNTPVFRQVPLNELAKDSDGLYPLELLNDLLEPKASGNSVQRQVDDAQVYDDYALSASQTVQTQIYTSDATDYGDIVPHTLQTLLLKHWLVSATSLGADYQIVITPPGSDELVSMPVMIAAWLFIACWMRASNDTSEELPEVVFDDIYDQVRVPDMQLNSPGGLTTVQALQLSAILNIDDSVILEPQEFYTRINRLHSALREQWLCYTQLEDPLTYAQALVWCRALSRDAALDPNGMSVDDVLKESTIDTSGYARADWTDLMTLLFEACTRYSANRPKLMSTMQERLEVLMTRLLPYSASLVHTTSEENVLIVSGVTPRIRWSYTVESQQFHDDILGTDVRLTQTEDRYYRAQNDESSIHGPAITYTSKLNLDVSDDVQITSRWLADIQGIHELDEGPQIGLRIVYEPGYTPPTDAQMSPIFEALAR